MSNERIYGIDPGSIKDVEAANNLSEVDLYFNIDALGRHIWYCNHAYSHGRIDYVDLTEEQYAMEYLVYLTTKYGVELPEPQSGKHVEGTDSYWKWLRFYDRHFKETLTDQEWNDFQKAKKKGEDVSAYMPKGKWNDSQERKLSNKMYPLSRTN